MSPEQVILDIKVDPAHLAAVNDDERKLEILGKCATDFREFLRYWKFIDQRTGLVCMLGDELWSGQQKFVDTMKTDPRIFALKARKLGFTTLGCAYDAWVARFRDENCRVHLFSRREKAATALLEQVMFGLNRLPPWMRLPHPPGMPGTNSERRLFAGEDDVRILEAYPADKNTAVEHTCTHAHIDEWARMEDPERVYQAVQPSLAGSAHIITTGMGPDNYPAKFWRMTMSGDTDFKHFFVSALERPDRTAAWLAKMRKGMTETMFRQEYAMRWEDALFGGGEFTFAREDLDACDGGWGESPAEVGHKYAKGWDIGRVNDAAVGVVIDKTAQPAQVVSYVRMRQTPYPVQQVAIEKMHRAYKGLTKVEKNGPGEAVLENLDLPEWELEAFSTTKPSKAKMIANLEVAFENHYLEYNAKDHAQLDGELRAYQVPDDNVIQDSVMALAIAYTDVTGGATKGRVIKISSW